MLLTCSFILLNSCVFCSIDKLKPEKELQRASSEILQCKLRLREMFQRLDAICAEGAYPKSMFDSEGLLDSEDVGYLFKNFSPCCCLIYKDVPLFSVNIHVNQLASFFADILYHMLLKRDIY